MPALRHAVRGRRGPDRARTDRNVVRARALGARAGLRARRQGAQRRLHAGRRDGHDAARSTSGRSARSSARYVHQSTYGRNRLSMAAGLATLRIIERDGLVEHAARIGGVLFDGLAELQQRYEMIREVRGRGLMIGIELRAPNARVARLNWRLIHIGQRGTVPAADRDPAAPRSRRDHDGRRQERRDQAAAAADAVGDRRRAASSTRSTRCSRIATARRARTGRSCVTSRRRRLRGRSTDDAPRSTRSHFAAPRSTGHATTSA